MAGAKPRGSAIGLRQSTQPPTWILTSARAMALPPACMREQQDISQGRPAGSGEAARGGSQQAAGRLCGNRAAQPQSSSAAPPARPYCLLHEESHGIALVEHA